MPEDYDSFDSKQRRKFWENHIEKWKISSLSQRAYCKKNDLILHRFYDWKRRIMPVDKTRVTFLPVALNGSATRKHPSVRIHTPNGFTIEVDDQNGSIEINKLVAMVATL